MYGHKNTSTTSAQNFTEFEKNATTLYLTQSFLGYKVTQNFQCLFS